jgi:hypothetical protein
MMMRAAGAFLSRRLEPRHEGSDKPALGTEFAQVQLGAHGVIGRLKCRLRRQRVFIHAKAIFSHQRGHTDADAFHAGDELGGEILVLAAAHQIVVDQRMAPGFQLAIAAGAHQIVVGVKNAELIFEREARFIA